VKNSFIEQRGTQRGGAACFIPIWRLLSVRLTYLLIHFRPPAVGLGSGY